jgi:hypothetical protein
MKAKIALSFVSVLTLGACITEEDPANTQDDDSTDIPRLATNGMLPSYIVGSSLNRGILNDANLSPYASTTNSRSFLGYLVGCALTSSQTVTTHYNGIPYSFTGALGLASAWTSRSLNSAESNWVSACVLARANETGTTVTVSMRGTNSQLFLQSGESTNYATQEGAFYGNIFTTPVVWYACNGTDQANHDGYGDLALRQCADTSTGTTPCGYTYRALCSANCSTNTGTGGYYAGCTDGLGGSYAEVITTYVAGNPQ